MEFRAALKELVKRGADDILGDKRYLLGKDPFEDRAMLRVVPPLAYAVQKGAAELVIMNAKMALTSGSQLYSILTECVRYVQEALKLWSKVRAEETVYDMQCWLRQLSSTIVGSVAAAVAVLYDMVAPHIVDSAEMEAEADESAPECQAVAAKLDRDLTTIDFERNYLAGSNFLADYDNFKRELAALAKAFSHLSNGLAAEAQSLLQKSEANMAIIGGCLNLVREVSVMKMDAFSASAVEIIEQWRANPEDNDAALNQALGVVVAASAVQALPETIMSLGLWDEASLCSVEVKGQGDLSATTKRGWGDLEKVATLVMELPPVHFARSTMELVADEIIQWYWSALEMNAMRMPSPTTDLTSKTFQGLAETLFDPAGMAETATVAVRCFRGFTNMSDMPTLACTKHHTLVVDVLSVGNSYRVHISKGMVRGKAVTGAVSVDDIVWLSHLYKVMAEVVSGLIFLQHTVKGRQSCFDAHKFRSDLRVALGFSDAKCDELERALADTKRVDAFNSIGVDWVMPLTVVGVWASTAKAVVLEIAARCLGFAVEEATDVSNLAERITPKFDHYINDDHFAKNLASKSMLAASVANLSAESVHLFQSISQVGSMQKAFKIATLPAAAKEALDIANAVFSSAKRAVVVRTACHIVLELSGRSRRRRPAACWRRSGASSRRAW